MTKPGSITAELKGWDCTDHDPIEKWIPGTDEVVYWLVCHIGEPGLEASDMFTVPVVNTRGLHSPAWKQRHKAPAERQVIPIVVDPYSWEGVLAAVNERIREASDYSWSSVQDKLRKLFHWEYEGMPPRT